MATVRPDTMGNADPVQPNLSTAERDRRWREVRWRMDLAGLDCLLVWGNESKMAVGAGQ